MALKYGELYIYSTFFYIYIYILTQQFSVVSVALSLFLKKNLCLWHETIKNESKTTTPSRSSGGILSQGIVGKAKVNIVTWKMERADQGGSPQGKLEKADILREFQTSFFSMSRLVSFPWTVSRN